jgi:hypothetical protein
VTGLEFLFRGIFVAPVSCSAGRESEAGTQQFLWFPIGASCGMFTAFGLVLEPPDSRLEFSEFLVVLPWWLLSHTQKVFVEMYVRQ